MLFSLTRRPRRLKIVLISIGCVLAAAGITAEIFALTVYYAFDSKRAVVDAFPAGHRPAVAASAAGAMNILLLGTDVDSKDSESPQFVGKKEADTVMLLHVPADRSKIYAVSILRNSLVEVPGHGEQAVNAAYAYGGVKLTVQTVEELLDVRVDHVVDVSLSGLKGLTDAIGGVEVRSPEAFSNDGIDFPAGTAKLNGTQALAYLRAGDFRATGDGQRASAQERYFRGVLTQVLSARTRLDPVSVSSAVNTISPYLATDPGFDANAILSLGISLRSVRGADLVTLRVPDSGVSTRDGATVVDLDANGVRVLSGALHSDAMFAYSD